MIKVLIADDQALIRESLQIILSAHADIEVVGTVGDGKEVLEKLHRVRPDVILMDIRMPVMDGVLCTKAVKEQYPDVKIIILTTFDDDEFIFSALKYGASGYILKGVSTEELHEAIQTVYRGGAMINPNIATKVFKIFSQMAQSNFAITVTEENIEDMSQSNRYDQDNQQGQMSQSPLHLSLSLLKSLWVTPVCTAQIASWVRSRKLSLAKIPDR